MRYVIGIDAGGTKTVGLLADETGQILGEARGGGANLQTHGELDVEKVFHDVMDTLSGDKRIAAVCLGIAGVDRPHDESVIREILRRLGHRDSARVVNDAAIALVAGSPSGIGIVILAGTGSIAYGVDPQGRSARSGGYGFLLADEGSGYWLGHQALRAAVRAADGRGPQTRLKDLIFEALDVSTVQDLVPRVYEKGLPKHRIAGLAGLVQKAKQEGDAVAEALLNQAVQELTLAGQSVHRRLDFGRTEYKVILAGGAFRACPELVTMLSASLTLPDAEVELLSVEPACGAVTLALGLLR